VDGKTSEVVDWSDLGQRMWSFLTGSQAPRATWKIDGTLTVTTHENDRSRRA